MHASKSAHQVKRTDLARASTVSVPVITPKRMDGVPFTCMKGSYSGVGASKIHDERSPTSGVESSHGQFISGELAWRARSFASGGRGTADVDRNRASISAASSRQRGSTAAAEGQTQLSTRFGKLL
eukprot:scaffold34197_cov70-Phaeocystis_antarctica.AAC.3